MGIYEPYRNVLLEEAISLFDTWKSTLSDYDECRTSCALLGVILDDLSAILADGD